LDQPAETVMGRNDDRAPDADFLAPDARAILPPCNRIWILLEELGVFGMNEKGSKEGASLGPALAKQECSAASNGFIIRPRETHDRVRREWRSQLSAETEPTAGRVVIVLRTSPPAHMKGAPP